MLNKSFKYILILLMLIYFTSTVAVFGNDYYSHQSNFIREGHEVEGDFIVVHGSGVNEGRIIGDFIVFGEGLINRGLVEGDILSILSSNIYSSGIVKGNIRSISSEVIINGEVNRNASIVANRISLKEEGVIDGSLYVFGNIVTVNGFIGGDIRGAVNTLHVDGTIKGNVEIYTKNIHFNSGAKIEGDLVYVSNEELHINPQYVNGVIQHRYPEADTFQNQFSAMGRRILKLSKVLRTLFMVAYLIVGSVLVTLFRKPYKIAADIIEKVPLASIGVGIAVLISTPIISTLLLITIIGIPLGMITLTTYGLLLYLARIPVALWIGSKIIKGSPHPVISFIIGSLLISASKLIPYSGWLVSFGVTVLGLGATLIMLKRYYKKEEATETTPPSL